MTTKTGKSVRGKVFEFKAKKLRAKIQKRINKIGAPTKVTDLVHVVKPVGLRLIRSDSKRPVKDKCVTTTVTVAPLSEIREIDAAASFKANFLRKLAAIGMTEAEFMEFKEAKKIDHSLSLTGYRDKVGR